MLGRYKQKWTDSFSIFAVCSINIFKRLYEARYVRISSLCHTRTLSPENLFLHPWKSARISVFSTACLAAWKALKMIIKEFQGWLTTWPHRFLWIPRQRKWWVATLSCSVCKGNQIQLEHEELISSCFIIQHQRGKADSEINAWRL